MEEEEPRMVPIPCVHCGAEPVAGYELRGGKRINLCFEHMQQFDEMQLRKIETYRELADRAEDQLADVFGMPRPQRPSRIVSAPRVNVHQVHIHGDNYGIVNTGTVGSIENSLTIISGQDAALATRLREFTEAVIGSAELTPKQKQESAELLREIAEDTAKPPTKRRSKAVMRAIASGLETYLANAANLATLWAEVSKYLAF